MRLVKRLLILLICLQAGIVFAGSSYDSTVYSLLDKGDLAMEKHNLPLYLKYGHTLMDLAKVEKDSNSMVKCCIRFVDFYTFSQRNNDSILKYRNMGIYWARLIKDLESETDFEFMKAALLETDGKYVEAYRLFQSIDVIMAKNDFDFAPYFHNSYASLLFNLKEFRKGIARLKIAANIFEQRKSLPSVASIDRNIGIQYMGIKQYDSALIYLNKALSIVTEKQDTFRMAENYSKIGEIFKKAGDYKKALEYFKTSFQLNHKDPSDNLLTNYTEVLITEGKNAEAEHILRNFIDSNFGPKTKLNALSALINLKKKEKKFEEALLLSEEYIRKDQELLNVEKVKQIEELQTQYDVANKETEINTLKERNNHQAQSLKKNKIIAIASAGLFCMVLLAIVLTFRNRAIRQKAEQILLEQQLLRSQMNPHFIFNSLSTIQSTVLQKEHLKAAGYIATFSKLVRNILENSTQGKVTFAKEMTALNDYLLLQKIRYQEHLNYAIEIDPDIEEDMMHIPPMLFQPLVENAIEHGISATNDGFININFSLFDKYIHCEVTDNGVGYGYATEKARGNKSKTSLSTKIIKERLAILSKQTKHTLNYNIEAIETQEGLISGTRVTIDIPILS